MFKRLQSLILCILIIALACGCEEQSDYAEATVVELPPRIDSSALVSSEATSTEVESQAVSSISAASSTAVISSTPESNESSSSKVSSQTASSASSESYIISFSPSAQSSSQSVSSQSTSSQPDNRDYINEILKLVNNYRANEGLYPLVLDDRLVAAADIRANEITEAFSHTRPNGKTAFTALIEAGITFTNAGENIASGQKDAVAVFESWISSPSHRANILSDDFTAIGIGHAYKANDIYGHYWVQMFAYTI